MSNKVVFFWLVFFLKACLKADCCCTLPVRNEFSLFTGSLDKCAVRMSVLLLSFCYCSLSVRLETLCIPTVWLCPWLPYLNRSNSIHPVRRFKMDICSAARLWKRYNLEDVSCFLAVCWSPAVRCVALSE